MRKRFLVIGIIFLFFGLVVQSGIAIIPKENILESNYRQDDARWFATLNVNFGEEIYNAKIYRLWWKLFLPAGNYSVHVKINFRCPSDKRIDGSYLIRVVMVSEFSGDIIFCDLKDTFTIINGSNPPDIDEKFVKYCFYTGYIGGWSVFYYIIADLDVYDFVDGDWVLINEDHIDKEEYGQKEFYESNTLFFEFLNVLWLPFYLFLML